MERISLNVRQCSRYSSFGEDACKSMCTPSASGIPEDSVQSLILDGFVFHKRGSIHFVKVILWRIAA